MLVLLRFMQLYDGIILFDLFVLKGPSGVFVDLFIFDSSLRDASFSLLALSSAMFCFGLTGPGALVGCFGGLAGMV